MRQRASVESKEGWCCYRVGNICWGIEMHMFFCGTPFLRVCVLGIILNPTLNEADRVEP